jgi:ubiquinone/menaquinone biosynthesis C-methylase UbiE
VTTPSDRYTHGHHESVLRSHTWRTAENSAGFLLPHLQRGQSVLDVGCGPGTISADIAHLVAPGPVTGIDLSSEVIELARRGAEGANDTNLSFHVGDVYDLQFADSSFDVVYAHQVLQHLSDPVRALGEMRRVLTPGGLVAVRDADYGRFTWSPRDARLERWMALYHDITKRNGAEADAGRFLVDWVRDAGFKSWTTSTSQWRFRTDDERAWWGGLWSDRVLKSEFARQGVEFDLTTSAELNEISAAFLGWSEDPEAEFTVVHDEVLARTASAPMGNVARVAD